MLFLIISCFMMEEDDSTFIDKSNNMGSPVEEGGDDNISAWNDLTSGAM